MNYRPLAIVGLTAVVTLITYYAGLSREQVLSTAIFFLFIFSTLLFWWNRVSIAFLGITGLLASGVLNVENLIAFANFDIILFLLGMMVIIGFLEKRHFFEYLVSNVLRFVGDRGKLVVVSLMLMSGLFAALVDEVTSILFMVSMTLELVDRYKLSPLPFVLMVVFATNIGSSATVVGNPIGVLIALKGGLTFMDFLRWATPITLLALFLTIAISLLYFSSHIGKLGRALKEEGFIEKEIRGEDIRTCWAFTFLTLPLLIFHSQMEHLLGLEKNTMLLGAAFLAAGLALLLEGEEAKELVEKRVDWWTLTFFALLFASVGTLKFVGTTSILGEALVEVSGGSEAGLLGTFTVATALLTPMLDNVLVVAVFTPIVESLPEMGLPNFHVWWGMLFGGTFFGNLTMIGSTANIVAIGMLESRGLGKVTLSQWIKPGLLVSIPTLALALALIYLQLPYML